MQAPLYVFLKEALVRKYGRRWFEELELAAKNTAARVPEVVNSRKP
jgi:hypothetical protein